MLYPDKSTYSGSFVKNVREGYGKYTWATGETYDGNWRRNKIEGTGIFATNTPPPGKPKTFQGVFKNNYFKYSETIYINPLLTQDDLETVLKNKEKIDKIKEERNVKALHFCQRARDYSEMVVCMKKSFDNFRVPLIISTKGYKTASFKCRECDGFQSTSSLIIVPSCCWMSGT